MNALEKNIIKFLVDGKAYSDTAIMKNFGIDYDELQKIYKNLEEEGYLESYEIYQDRQDSSSNCGGCSGGSCGGCSGGGCSGGGCSNESDPLGDFTEIRVLTDKALREFT